MRSRVRPIGGIGDSGFSLVEVIVALAILVGVGVASAPLFTGALQKTASLGVRQTAVTVATQRLEYVRSLDGKQLVSGRALADVSALNASPGLTDLSQDVVTSATTDQVLNYDPTAPNSNMAAVTLTQTQTLNNVIFTVRTFINVCYLAQVSPATCTRSASNGKPVYRVSVDVAWPKPAGVPCASGRGPTTCEYVATLLRDPNTDPIFSRNAAPAITAITSNPVQVSAAPVVVHPGQQVTLTLTGTNFVYGATLTSRDPADTLGAVIYPSANQVSATFLPATSPVLGTHSLVLANPDGGSTSATVSVIASAPTILTVLPIIAPRSVATTFTVTGSDFYAAYGPPLVPPTVSISAAVINSVTVTSPGVLTVVATMLNPGFAYTDNGTIVVTNPDGGSVTSPIHLAVP